MSGWNLRALPIPNLNRRILSQMIKAPHNATSRTCIQKQQAENTTKPWSNTAADNRALLPTRWAGGGAVSIVPLSSCAVIFQAKIRRKSGTLNTAPTGTGIREF